MTYTGRPVRDARALGSLLGERRGAALLAMGRTFAWAGAEPRDTVAARGAWQEAPLIAQLAPETHDLLADLPAPPPLESAEARFRLFHSITVALQNVARTQPLLLVLDDLHWADKPSVLLLEFLLPYITGSRLLIVGAYRDTDVTDRPLGEALGSLRRDQSFDVVPLKGLSVGAVRQLLENYPDPSVRTRGSGADLAQVLWQATEGNPLFVREELRYLMGRIDCLS